MTQKKHCCLRYHEERLAAIVSFLLAQLVRCITDRFLAAGSSDNQLYFALAELVTSAELTPFV